MKKCELCKLRATLYCESDQANLCASCDLRVHEANFLVARHSRTLLCKTCQSPTPWEASGARLGNIETECAKCVAGGKEENEGGEADVEMCKDGEVFAEVEPGEESDESETGASDDEAKECENQVLPSSISPPPPPDASSSSSDESSSSSSSSLCASRRRSQKRLRHRSSISE